MKARPIFEEVGVLFLKVGAFVGKKISRLPHGS